jgi:hypothetical protein
MSPKQQMQLDFKDGSGPLAGAAVTEYGVHDITPGIGGAESICSGRDGIVAAGLE